MLAAALAGLVYLNALNNPFVYDDHDTVVANPSLTNVRNVRFVLVHGAFRPLVNVSYAADRLVWGYRPFGFHLTNVLLHMVVTVLLFAFLRAAMFDAARKLAELAPVTRSRPPSTSQAELYAAFTGAALFAVHPLMTEAVAYVSGRSELLCATWFLLTILLARRAILHGNVIAAAAAFATGALALASKEVAAALPFVILAYDWLLLPGTERERRRRFWGLHAPLCVLLAVAAGYRVVLLQEAAAGMYHPPLLSALTQSIVIWRYLRLAVWPVGQSIMHSIHQVGSPGDPLALVAVTGLLVLFLLAIRVRRTAPLLTFATIWYFACIAPSSSVIALRESMAEHRAYLATAGVCLVVASGVLRWGTARQRTHRAWVAYRFALGGAIAVLALLTVARNEVWSSPVRLWREATVSAAGMWEPRYALADVLREAKDYAGAVPEYEAVIRARPMDLNAHTNLGICLAEIGRFKEAEAAFRQTLAIEPKFARGYTNLGALALVRGDVATARDAYQEALKQDPRNVLARMQLARILETSFHDYHAAARMCGEARALAPSTPGVVECVERNRKLAASADAGS